MAAATVVVLAAAQARGLPQRAVAAPQAAAVAVAVVTAAARTRGLLPRAAVMAAEGWAGGSSRCTRVPTEEEEAADAPPAGTWAAEIYHKVGKTNSTLCPVV